MLFNSETVNTKMVALDHRDLWLQNPLKAKPIYSVAQRFQEKLSQSRMLRKRVARKIAAKKRKVLSSIAPPPVEGKQSPTAVTDALLIPQHSVLILGKRSKYRNQLGRLLKGQYRTIAGDLDTASLLAIQREQPSLIILGPGLSRSETATFLRRLKSNTASWYIPVLQLLSQHSDRDKPALLNQTDKLLQLPLMPRQVAQAVHHMISKQKPVRKFGVG